MVTDKDVARILYKLDERARIFRELGRRSTERNDHATAELRNEMAAGYEHSARIVRQVRDGR